MSFLSFFFLFIIFFRWTCSCSLCSSLVFFPIINLQQKTQTQILTKHQTHIRSKENLSLQTYKFSWQTNTKKPTGNKNSKSPPLNQRTWRSKPRKRIETQQPTKHHHWIKSSTTTSMKPLQNQTIQRIET